MLRDYLSDFKPRYGSAGRQEQQKKALSASKLFNWISAEGDYKTVLRAR